MSSSEPRNLSANFNQSTFANSGGALCEICSTSRASEALCRTSLSSEWIRRSYSVRTRARSFQNRCWISPDWCCHGSFEVGVLGFHLLAIVGVHQGDAMLKGSLQFGNAPQELNFRVGEFLLPARAPLGPVVPNIPQLARLASQLSALTPPSWTAPAYIRSESQWWIRRMPSRRD